MSYSELSKFYNRRVRLEYMRAKQRATFEPAYDLVSGVVFSVSGSIYADIGASYVWVHEWGALASQAQAYLPPNINVWNGAGVLMQKAPRKPYEFEIIRVNTSPYPRAILDTATSLRRAQVGPHGENHQYPNESTIGPDPVLIWHSAIQIFKAVVTTGLQVRVGPLVYDYNGVRRWFPLTPTGDTVDLTSYLPSSGKAARVLIYLDKATGALAVTSSAEVTAPGVPAYPVEPYEAISSAYFYLEDTYTSLSMESDYTDARRFLGGSVQAVSTLPTEAGQSLYANDDLQWEPGFLVMDEDTLELVYDDDTGQLIWGS